MASLYGSYGLKKFMGREFMGVFRHTFVIDGDGRLVKIYRKVKPADWALAHCATAQSCGGSPQTVNPRIEVTNIGRICQTVMAVRTGGIGRHLSPSRYGRKCSSDFTGRPNYFSSTS